MMITLAIAKNNKRKLQFKTQLRNSKNKNLVIKVILMLKMIILIPTINSKKSDKKII